MVSASPDEVLFLNQILASARYVVVYMSGTRVFSVARSSTSLRWCQSARRV